MIENIFDNKWIRICLGVLVGIPFTLAALIGSIHGLVLFFAGIRNNELWAIALGAASMIGLLGLWGAWWRLRKPLKTMSDRERLFVKALLVIGTATSLFLASLSWFWGQWGGGAIIGILVAAVGIVLIIATPQIRHPIN